MGDIGGTDLGRPIDFVVTWVDDTDLGWQELREQYSAEARGSMEGASELRYRDWGALRYWFRGVLRFCPWVRRIHLVTTNAPPSWLDVDDDRISIVRHEQIIDEEYLPTFSSRVIELNLHKIPGLSEDFVYFNDDMYVLRPLEPEHFFPGGKPAGMAIQTALSVGDNISHAMLNNLRVINTAFDKRSVIRNNVAGWFSPRYGRMLAQNIALSPWPRFTGFHNHHLPLALHRSTFTSVWNHCHEAIVTTLGSRFRQFSDVNIFLMSYWQLCTGDFIPVSPGAYGLYEQLSESNVGCEAADIISSARAALLCLNDGDVPDYMSTARLIEHAMLARTPHASDVEKS